MFARRRKGDRDTTPPYNPTRGLPPEQYFSSTPPSSSSSESSPERTGFAFQEPAALTSSWGSSPSDEDIDKYTTLPFRQHHLNQERSSPDQLVKARAQASKRPHVDKNTSLVAPNTKDLIKAIKSPKVQGPFRDFAEGRLSRTSPPEPSLSLPMGSKIITTTQTDDLSNPMVQYNRRPLKLDVGPSALGKSYINSKGKEIYPVGHIPKQNAYGETQTFKDWRKSLDRESKKRKL